MFRGGQLAGFRSASERGEMKIILNGHDVSSECVSVKTLNFKFDHPQIELVFNCHAFQVIKNDNEDLLVINTPDWKASVVK